MNRFLFSFILLVFFSLGAVAQNNKNQTPHSKIVSYHLSQVASQQQLDEVKAELSKFKYVTNVVVTDLSSEETLMVKIYVTETVTNEGDAGFDQAGLKKFFASKGIKASKLKIEELN